MYHRNKTNLVCPILLGCTNKCCYYWKWWWKIV